MHMFLNLFIGIIIILSYCYVQKFDKVEGNESGQDLGLLGHNPNHMPYIVTPSYILGVGGNILYLTFDRL